MKCIYNWLKIKTTIISLPMNGLELFENLISFLLRVIISECRLKLDSDIFCQKSLRFILYS